MHFELIGSPNKKSIIECIKKEIRKLELLKLKYRLLLGYIFSFDILLRGLSELAFFFQVNKDR